MRRLLHYLDKVALVACVLLFFGSALWAMWSFRKLEAIAALNPAVGLASARYEAHTAQTPTLAQVSWPEPSAQSRGRDWVYDTFTPPVIYFNPDTKEFTVTPPVATGPAIAIVETPFEIELVAVRQEPYRLQLVGYAGNETDYIAHIEIVDTGAVILARPGAAYPEAKGSFTLRSFDVRRVTTNSSESMPVVENLGFAVVLDGRTGREVTLTTRERLMLPRLQCVVRTRTYPVEEQVLREGMKITVNGYDYLIVQLSLNPAQAVVSRRDGKSLTGENRTLYPVPGTAGNPGALTAPVGPDNSIDLRSVSLFPNTRHDPSVDRSRVPPR